MPVLSVKGYFDGTSIIPLEEIPVKQNQKVIITVLDEFMEPEKSVSRLSMRGALARYANPALIEEEKNAWERAAAEKRLHGNDE